MRSLFASSFHSLDLRSAAFRALGLATLGLVLTACGEGDDGGSGGGSSSGGTSGGSSETYCNPASTCPYDASAEDLGTPVSFRGDVFPIFQASCNDSSCHGSQNGAFGGLYLGPETGTPTEAQYSQIVTMLTTKTPEVTSDIGLVTPSNWQQSLMMLKADGCQNDAGLTCGESPFGSFCNEPCGDAMPPLAPNENPPFPISVEDRRVLRAWIAQGAQDN